MNRKKAASVLALCLFLGACASQNHVASSPQMGTEAAQADFDRGMRALEHEDYSGAAAIFDRLLVSHPGSEFELVTAFDSGAAHEGMGECAQAATRYRQVIQASAGKFHRIEAQALFRLSLAYECLGDDVKTVTALLDARRRGKELPQEVARAELPARLAAAYSRLGNRKKALQYFTEANQGLKGILASGKSTATQKETMAKTLYYMGRLNSTQKSGTVDPLAFLKSLSLQQPYLLQAVEINHPTWTRKAIDDLTTAYDNLLHFEVKGPQRRHEYYVRVQQVIAELRKIRLPDAGPQEDEVFTQVDKTERRLQTLMADAAVGTPLTQEAKEREGLKRKGRAVDPSTPNSRRKKKLNR